MRNPETGRQYKLCKECGQPMLPKGAVKKPNEYDHAQGCPKRSGIPEGSGAMKQRIRNMVQIIRELEKRAAYFERRCKRTEGTEASFDLGAASNLRAMALWCGSAEKSKLPQQPTSRKGAGKERA